jgi:protein SCO1/2
MLLLLICAAAYASLVISRTRTPDAPSEPLPQPATSPYEFTFTDQHEQPYEFERLRGHVWVGSFFFANCPGPCWKLNEGLAQLQAELADDEEVLLVSLTCDPANDTPQVLEKYAERFHAQQGRWTFLTGELGELQRFGQSVLRAVVETQTHSDRAFVFNREGELRGKFDVRDPHELARLKKLVHQLAAEKSLAK